MMSSYQVCWYGWRSNWLRLFVERYTGELDSKGKVPKAWKESRKQLVQNNLYRVLNNHREEPIAEGLWVETCDVTVVMEPFLMRKARVFASVVIVNYRELREVA